MRPLVVFKIALPFLLITSLLIPPLLLHMRHNPSPTCFPLESFSWIINPAQNSNSKLPLKSNSNSSSCTSRKHSKQEALPAEFLQVISDYTKLHRRCYQTAKQSILSVNNKGLCKYLIHHETGSVSDRILSLASAFIYSVVSNRALLIDPRGELSSLLCEPFMNSSWVLPMDFPFERVDEAPSLLDAPFFGDHRDSNIAHVWLLEKQNKPDSQFFCRRTRDLLDKITFVVWSSNLYSIPRFFTFFEYWEFLSDMFPDPTLAFSHVRRFLINPQDHVWKKIMRIHTSYLSAPGRQVGLQITTQSLSFEKLMTCLVENGVLPALVNSTEDLNPAQQLKLYTSQKKIKVVISSLEQGHYEQMKRIYTNFPTVDGTLVQIHKLYETNQEDMERELVELFILGLSDQLLTSSCSSLGYAAQGIAGVKPYIFDQSKLSNCEVEACIKGQTVDPCNRFPNFQKECEESDHREWEKIHLNKPSSWAKLHIRPCQDADEGIQIV